MGDDGTVGFVPTYACTSAGFAAGTINICVTSICLCIAELPQFSGIGRRLLEHLVILSNDVVIKNCTRSAIRVMKPQDIRGASMQELYNRLTAEGSSARNAKNAAVVLQQHSPWLSNRGRSTRPRVVLQLSQGCAKMRARACRGIRRTLAYVGSQRSNSSNAGRKRVNTVLLRLLKAESRGKSNRRKLLFRI